MICFLTLQRFITFTTAFLYFSGKSGGTLRLIVNASQIPFLGSIPIDPVFSEAADAGIPVVKMHPDSLTATAFVRIAETLAGQLPAKEVPDAPPEESRPCPGSSIVAFPVSCN